MSLRSVISLVIILCGYTLAMAKGKEDESLSCSLIPEGLKLHANAVVRSAHMQVHIVSANEVIVTERRSITILNEKGRRYAGIDAGYSVLESIERMQGWLYDKDGNEVEKLKKSGIKDIGWSANFFDDFRHKAFSFDYSQYPYTVVYEVEQKYNHTFHLPVWSPMPGRDVAVMSSDIELYYPKAMAVRYKAFHIQAQPELTTVGEERKIALAVNGLHGIKEIPAYSPEENFTEPALLMAANHFALLDEQGDMSSWKDFGAFIYKLNNNRDRLPEDKKKLVHQLTDTCRTTYGKISLLYRYMQETSRYVSIQLGIGGWQTLEASFVADKGYGDCKALSNYTMALLKEAGITSYQTLVAAGREDYNIMDTSFPCSMFNHVILCVPQKEDTVWLECTSHTLPAGYLSAFTAERNVLTLMPQGGLILSTPAGDDKVNALCRKAELTIDDNNEVKGTIDETYSGYWWEREGGVVNNKPKSETDNYLNRKFAIPTYSTTAYKISNMNNRLPVLYEHISLSGSGIANRAGKGLILSPRLFKPFHEQFAVHEERKIPFEIPHNYSVTDTVVLHLPQVYSPHGLAKDIDMEYPFGSYMAHMWFENGQLKIVSRYRQKKGVYPPAQYADFARLCTEAGSVSDIIMERRD